MSDYNSKELWSPNFDLNIDELSDSLSPELKFIYIYGLNFTTILLTGIFLIMKIGMQKKY